MLHNFEIYPFVSIGGSKDRHCLRPLQLQTCYDDPCID
jgi:hypothetical protein